MTLAEHYTFGDVAHVALSFMPCLRERSGQRRRHTFLNALHQGKGFRDIRAIGGGVVRSASFELPNLIGVDQFASLHGTALNMFVGVACRTSSTGRDIAACGFLGALYADLDFKDASESEFRARVAAFPFAFSAVIFTGGGLHVYLFLKEPIDLREEKGVWLAGTLLKALAKALGADMKAAEPARVLRLPGTLNHKYQPPREVVFEDFDADRRYAVETLAAELPWQVADNATDSGRTTPSPPLADTIVEGGRNDALFIEACRLRRHGYDEPEILALLTTMNQRRGRPPLPQREVETIAKGSTKYQPSSDAANDLILSPHDPLPGAREFVAREHTVQNTIALRHQANVFYEYTKDAGAYLEQDEPAIRAQLYRFLERAKRWRTEKELVSFQPTKSKVENVLDALRAVTNLPTSIAAPCWLKNSPGLNPLDMLAFPGGLLHIPTRSLHASTPDFFTLNSIDFAYDLRAPEPVQWLAFLSSLWPDDAESIDTVQEIFGYILTPDTRFQKIFLEVGPPRSGKGVKGRVLQRLVGKRNTCSPTLAAFGRDFGKHVLVGKTLAIISDARISGRTDTASVAETLLSISGEDTQTVERKFLPDWNGKLSTRFLMLTNELPRITDVSGALAKRFILLALKRSFYGQEDLGLFDRLVPELPGILNWALEGRDRLYARGYFVQPKSAHELIQEFEDLGSPEATFLHARTRPEAGAVVSQKELFGAWITWCQENGRDKPGTAQTFGRNVRAALPWVKTRQLGERGQQERYWEGLQLTPSEGI